MTELHHATAPTEATEQQVNPSLTVDELLGRFRELTLQAEDASIYLPWDCYSKISKIDREMQSLQHTYSEYIRRYAAAFQGPIATGMLPSDGPILRLGTVMTYMMNLQWARGELVSTRDKKTAFAFGKLSLYVSFISLIVSVISLCVSF